MKGSKGLVSNLFLLGRDMGRKSSSLLADISFLLVLLDDAFLFGNSDLGPLLFLKSFDT